MIVDIDFTFATQRIENKIALWYFFTSKNRVNLLHHKSNPRSTEAGHTAH